MKTITEFAPGLYSSGQPTTRHLDALAATGVRTVINLRTADEAAGFDEAEIAQGLGMAYVAIPIAGPSCLTRENARLLAQALTAAASGNRVGAMLALVSAWEGNTPAPDALRIGASAGLTTLEPVVSRLLE
jgi:protein tyrosine phosphatase (PTP) superfamily phosphohydrolase (DUF442 family)